MVRSRERIFLELLVLVIARGGGALVGFDQDKIIKLQRFVFFFNPPSDIFQVDSPIQQGSGQICLNFVALLLRIA